MEGDEGSQEGKGTEQECGDRAGTVRGVLKGQKRLSNNRHLEILSWYL